MANATCAHPDRKALARGMCSSCYSAWWRTENPGRRDRSGETARRRAKEIASVGIDELRRRQREAKRRSRGTPTERQRLARRKQRRAARGRRTRIVWSSGPCPSCGSCVVSQFNGSFPAYCSDRCRWRAKRAIRRSRRAGAPSVSRVQRYKIFARDAFACQLCMEPLDMDAAWPDDWSPVLDHIVPLAAGGAHVESNLQAAHAWCNSVKGAGDFPLAM